MLYQTENRHGGDIYGGGIALDFSANVSPLGTPRSVTDAIERALPELPLPRPLLPDTRTDDLGI